MKSVTRLFTLSALLFSLPLLARPMVEIRTNRGVMVAELYSDKAPKTVRNFLQYVGDGFYSQTTFHRVIPGFMIQGGGLTASMEPKATRAPIASESNNGLKNQFGTLAMARTHDPDSATSQFFINLSDNKHLNYYKPTPDYMGYTVFGKLVKGEDVAEALSKQTTQTIGDFTDVPVEAITIEAIVRLPDSPDAPVASKPTSKKPVRKRSK
ncbi:peptidylprolyl isomerase [Leeia aquatica]|uniref:Peptidyl-prolyl cis-trans isomerase n=1 Tax=Leeia aquatica TaxID=2725557 RepID=A0A847S5F0_9NEIS|nr:peptidylprolyl isomerase [Leeia aquatica]NLR75064.1 peptidyl-prolyl cis-trans isomerase [Leeia aquatica]